MRSIALGLAFVWAMGCKDSDGDGTRDGRDCAASDPTIHRNAEEVCDGVDNDCDGLVDEDVAMVAYWDRDGDGFGDPDFARRVCVFPDDGGEVAGDCDDDDPLTHEGAAEVCDETDNDCDGVVDNGVGRTFYLDADGDGRGSPDETLEACFAPVGYAPAPDDCDDGDPEAWTDRPEQCDGLDNDCDGLVDEDVQLRRFWADADDDGFGDPNRPLVACGVAPGVADNALDCNDADPFENPDALDSRANGVDDDCDGYIDEYGIGPGEEFASFDDLPPLGGLPDDVVLQFSAGTHLVNLDLRDDAESGWTIAGAGCDRTTLLSAGGGSVVRLARGALADLTVAGGTGTAVVDPSGLEPLVNDQAPTLVMGGGVLIEGTPGEGACADGDAGCVRLVDVCLQNNSAADRGGAMALVTGRARLTGGRIERNGAGGWGGGLYVHPDATAVIERAEIRDNTAGQHGGGLAVRGARAIVHDTVLAGNRTDGALGAGAFFGDIDASTDGDGAVGTITSTTFHANGGLALDAGSALAARESQVTVEASVFTGHADAVPVLSLSLERTAGRFGNDRCAEPVPDDGAVAPAPSCRTDGGGVTDCRLDVAAIGLAGNAGIDRVTRYLGAPQRDRPAWVVDRITGDPRYVSVDPGLTPAAWNLQLRSGSAFRSVLTSLDPGLIDLGAASSGPLPPDGDVDGDGIDNGTELAGGSNPYVSDANDDLDGDGLTVLDEAAADTDPAIADSDGDGVNDGVEVTEGTDPTDRSDRAPVADAGPDRPGVWVGETVVLSAAASFDPQGDPLSMAWSLDAVPGGSSATLTAPTQSETAFTPDVAGTYRVSLAASDAFTTTVHTIRVVAFDGVVVPDDAPTVSAALAMSSTVGVRPGTWVDVDVDVEGDRVTIVGLGETPQSVVLQGDGQGPVVDVRDGDRVQLANVTLTGGYNTDGGGLRVRTAERVVLDGVILEANGAERGGGAYIDRAELELRDTQIRDNRAQDEGGGLWFGSRGTVLTAVDSTFSGNIAARGGGAFVDSGARCFEGPANVDAHFARVQWTFNQALDGAALHHEGPTARVAFEHADVAGQVGRSVVHLDGGSLVSTSSAWAFNTGPIGSQVIGGRTADQATFTAGLGEAGPVDPGWASFIDDGEADEVLVGVLGSPLRDAGLGLDRDGSPADVGSCGGLDAPPACLRFGKDADADGLDDGWEVRFDLDPNAPDATADPDGDGLTNAAELAARTQPDDADSDEDGVDDALDVNPDEDGDARPVGEIGVVRDADLVTLDGTASMDPQGTALEIQWTVLGPPGSTPMLVDPEGAVASFLIDDPGVYVVSLVVGDSTAVSRTARAVIVERREVPVTTTLADALAAAGDHDVVVIDAGTRVIDPVEIDEVVRIRGAGPAATRLEPTSRGTSMFTVRRGGRLELSDLTLAEGNAFSGGGVRCSLGHWTAERVTLQDHLGRVGAAAWLQGCRTALTDVDLVGGQAFREGGGLWVEGGELSWTRGTARDNLARGPGGAVWAAGATVEIDNVVFAGNEAPQGAALRIVGDLDYEPGASTFGQLTVVGNPTPTGDGAMSFDDANDHRVIQSVFADNGGFDVYEQGFSNVTVRRSGFSRPAASAVNDVTTVNGAGDSNLLDAVPAFGDPDRFDLRLTNLSPFVDVGLGLDRDGSPADLGAFGSLDAPEGWDLYLIDTDGDGMDDGWELLVGLDPTVADGQGDADGDGLTNLEEYLPVVVGGVSVRTDPFLADTDGDGVDDDVERAMGRDPTQPEALALPLLPVETTVDLDALTTVQADSTSAFIDARWRFVDQPPTSALGAGDLSVNVNGPAGVSVASFTPDEPGRFVLGVIFEDANSDSVEVTTDVWVRGDLTVPDDYPTATDAITNLAAGSTVFLPELTEAVRLVRDRSTRVVGSGPGTILSGEGVGTVLTMTGGTLELEALTVREGRGLLGGGLSLTDADLVVTDVTITANEAYEGGGIDLRSGSLDAVGLRLVDNVAVPRGGGLIAARGQGEPQQISVVQSLVAGNVADNGGGVSLIEVDGAFANVVFANNLGGFRAGAVEMLGASDGNDLTFEHVTATHNAAGDLGGSFVVAERADVVFRNAILFRQDGASDIRLNANPNRQPTFAMTTTLVNGNVQPPFDFGAVPASFAPVPVNGQDGNQVQAGVPGFVDLTGDWSTSDWTIDPGPSTAVGAGLDDLGNPVDLGAFGGDLGDWSP